MFNLDKKTLMKRDIVEMLDVENRPIVSKMIQKKLQYGGLTTILNLCNELAEEMAEIYPDKRVHIEISKNGINLVRQGSSLQYFYDALFSKDLSYVIFKELICHRRTSTINFCMENGISESTLKRKVMGINHVLGPYHVKIQVSKYLTFLGNEADIRIVSYIFLLGVHRQFSQIPWLANKESILSMAKAILTYLKISVTEIRVEILALWIYVNTISSAMIGKCTMSQKQKEILSAMELLEKPAFLKLWKINDWKLTQAVIYSSEIFDFSLPYGSFKDKQMNTLFSYTCKCWVRCFEANFIPLKENQKKLIAEKIFLQFVRQSFSLNVDELINDEVRQFDFEQFTHAYPNYYNHFRRFWASFRQAIDGDYVLSERGELYNLLMCILLCPFEKILPNIHVYLYSDLSILYENFIKERIRIMTIGTCNVRFQKEPQDAEIIITTVPYPFSRKIKTKQQKILLIRPFFQARDLEELEQLILSASST